MPNARTHPASIESAGLPASRAKDYVSSRSKDRKLFRKVSEARIEPGGSVFRVMCVQVTIAQLLASVTVTVQPRKVTSVNIVTHRWAIYSRLPLVFTALLSASESPQARHAPAILVSIGRTPPVVAKKNSLLTMPIRRFQRKKPAYDALWPLNLAFSFL